MKQETDKDVWITVKVKESFRDRVNQATKELDTDLSKELRKSMRQLMIQAGINL